MITTNFYCNLGGYGGGGYGGGYDQGYGGGGYDQGYGGGGYNQGYPQHHGGKNSKTIKLSSWVKTIELNRSFL